jgi:hypothetical protein
MGTFYSCFAFDDMSVPLFLGHERAYGTPTPYPASEHGRWLKTKLTFNEPIMSDKIKET